MTRIMLNPSWTKEEHNRFLQKIKDNGGYCPCSILKTEETQCMCKAFREQEYSGLCHCERYSKIVDDS